MFTPAHEGMTGRRPSEPTEPEVPPGTAGAVMSGEGTEAAQPFRTHVRALLSDLERNRARENSRLASIVRDTMNCEDSRA